MFLLKFLLHNQQLLLLLLHRCNHNDGHNSAIYNNGLLDIRVTHLVCYLHNPVFQTGFGFDVVANLHGFDFSGPAYIPDFDFFDSAEHLVDLYTFRLPDSHHTHMVYAAIEFRGLVYLWDWKNNKMQHIDTSYQLDPVQVTPALDRVVTKAIDGMIRFWDMNGKEIFDIENRAAS